MRRAGVPAGSPFSPGTTSSRGARRLRTEPQAGVGVSAATAVSPRAGVHAAGYPSTPALHHAYSMSYLDSLATQLLISHTAPGGHHGHDGAHTLSTHAAAGFERGFSNDLELLVSSLEEENESLRCALAAERRARLRAEHVAAEALARLTELSQSQQQLVHQALQREASRARVERWLHAASTHVHCNAVAAGASRAAAAPTATTTSTVTPAPQSAVAAAAGEASSASPCAGTASGMVAWHRGVESAAAERSVSGSAACVRTQDGVVGCWGEPAVAAVAASAASAPASPLLQPRPEEGGPVPEMPPLPCPVFEALMHEVDELARRRGDSDAGGPAGPPRVHGHAVGAPHPHMQVLQPHVIYSRLAHAGPCGAASRSEGCEEYGLQSAEQPADGWGACAAPPGSGERLAATQVGQPAAAAAAAAAAGARSEAAGSAGAEDGAPVHPAVQGVHAVCHVWRRNENGLAAPAAVASAAALAPCVADAYEPCADHQAEAEAGAKGPIGGGDCGGGGGGGDGDGGGFNSARAMLQRACTLSALPVGQLHAYAHAQGAPPALVMTATHSQSSRQLHNAAAAAAAAAADWQGSPSVRVATPPAMVPRPRMMTMGGAEGPWATAVRMSSFAGRADVEAGAGAGAGAGCYAEGSFAGGFASGGGASGSPQAFASSVPRQCSTQPLPTSWQREPRLRPSDSGALANRASMSSALHAAAFGSSPHTRTASQSGGVSPGHASGAFSRLVLQSQHHQANGWDSRRGSFAGAASGQGLLGCSGAGGVGVGDIGIAGRGGEGAEAEAAVVGEGEGQVEWSSIPLQ